MTCLSIAKLNVSGSQSLTSSCRLKTGMLNGLLTAQSSSWVTITAWVSFGNTIPLICPSTARWQKYASATSNDAWKEIKTCMKNTVQSLMVTLPKATPACTLEKRLNKGVARPGTFLTTQLPVPANRIRFGCSVWRSRKVSRYFTKRPAPARSRLHQQPSWRSYAVPTGRGSLHRRHRTNVPSSSDTCWRLQRHSVPVVERESQRWTWRVPNASPHIWCHFLPLLLQQPYDKLPMTIRTSMATKLQKLSSVTFMSMISFKSVQTTDQATTLAVKLTGMLKEAGFRLTKFLSNRREVLFAFPSQERVNPTLNFELDNRTLGFHWDAERETSSVLRQSRLTNLLPSVRFFPPSAHCLTLLDFSRLSRSQSRFSFKTSWKKRLDGTMTSKIIIWRFGSAGQVLSLSLSLSPGWRWISRPIYWRPFILDVAGGADPNAYAKQRNTGSAVKWLTSWKMTKK